MRKHLLLLTLWLATTHSVLSQTTAEPPKIQPLKYHPDISFRQSLPASGAVFGFGILLGGLFSVANNTSANDLAVPVVAFSSAVAIGIIPLRMSADKDAAKRRSLARLE